MDDLNLQAVAPGTQEAMNKAIDLFAGIGGIRMGFDR